MPEADSRLYSSTVHKLENAILSQPRHIRGPVDVKGSRVKWNARDFVLSGA